jgi:hypothetical protein
MKGDNKVDMTTTSREEKEICDPCGHIKPSFDDVSDDCDFNCYCDNCIAHALRISGYMA